VLKLGIYVDAENVRLSGGYGMRYEVLIKRLGVGNHILRANSYVVEDEERIEQDAEYRDKLYSFFEGLRKAGFKVIKKTVKHYIDDTGFQCRKANADLDLAVDALVQSQNLDRIILVSGDSDFVRLITALQNRGIRVEVIGFKNVSRALKETADHFVNGFLIPGLIPCEGGGCRLRGWVAKFDEKKGYGFFHYYDPQEEGLVEKDVFFHTKNAKEGLDLNLFERASNIFEFDLVPSQSKQGKKQGEFEAINIDIFQERVLV